MTQEELKKIRAVAEKFKKETLRIIPGVFGSGGLTFIEGKPTLSVYCTESARKQILKQYGKKYLGYRIKFTVGKGVVFARA